VLRLFPLVLLLGCASTSSQHGTASTLTVAAAGEPLCAHRVPERVCTRHHPELTAGFKKLGDWCAEHDVPESQCLICHPDLTFEPLPSLQQSADLAWLTKTGDAVGALESHAVKGKVTVFDFYADWCAPCRKVDLHVYALLNQRADVAVRKINVISWDSAAAQEHLANAASLPFVVVFDKRGQKLKTVTGLELNQLDLAIEEAAR
jgi:thiol-disulfide isomerase/thioredoxin